MSTLIITVFCGLLSWRLVYPPLALLLFIFLDPMTTPGTAALMPFHAYVPRMAWGGLLGAALTSMMRLWQARNDGPGERFAWRVAVVCALMVVLIRLSIMLKANLFGVGMDTASVGPLTLIITLAYLHERRAWWCFGFMLVAQLCLAVYVVANPGSRFNGVYASVEDMLGAQDLLRRKSEEGSIGSRVMGQFTNTIMMATHAAVGLGAGLALLIASRRLTLGRQIAAILAGIGLATAGVYLLVVSATRGTMIGVGFGILVHIFRARGLVRLPLFVGTLLSVFVVAPHLATLIPEDSPLWGRFALLRDLKETQEYRIEAMRRGFDAIPRNPVLGTGDHMSGVEACMGYMPHMGPLYLAVVYGIPVALMGCAVLFWAGVSDLTAAHVKKDKAFPALRAPRAFGTICYWTVMACIMTNGYSGPGFMYMALGIAMWRMTCRRSVSPAASGYRTC